MSAAPGAATVTALPVHDVLERLKAALREGTSAVLVAPPGAGKTTAVAPALLDEPWCKNAILLLSPRRLAARAAAERISELASEPVGRTIGYATRLDSRKSAATRILVLTEGLFLARIQADPELAGVSAVLFDEVHERSLDSDFGLALALDAKAALRPDLRVLAMSATLDGARFAALLGDGEDEPAPVIESEGRSHPLDIVHLGRAAETRIEESMAAAIRRALAESDGGVLAFLPGVKEIERTAERLEGLPGDVDLHRLHGSLEPQAQRAAIAPTPPGRRKLVLATSIAETSLTIDGIDTVVDSGLARRPRYDRAAGVTRLVTERASRAAADQRAGRAARQRPGRALRLWEAAATAGLPRFDPPEILEADLSSLVLESAIWGAEPADLKWLDPPPPAGLAEAKKRLIALRALGEDGRPTPHGRKVARLPMPPRLAHMLIESAARGWGRTAAEAAVLVSERGLGGSDVDLEARAAHWRRERSRRADAARGLAQRWQKLIGAEGAAETPEALGACVALAFPDRVSKRRGGDGGDWLSVGGRGFRIDPASPLAKGEWLAVAEVSGAAAGARILSAAAIGKDDIEALFAERIADAAETRFDPATKKVRATTGRRLGALRLSGGAPVRPDPAAAEAALLEGVRRHGLGLLPWSESAEALRRRAAFARGHDARIPELSDEALTAALDAWLPPCLAGKTRLSDVDPNALTGALEGRFDRDARRALERMAPAWFESPAGSRHAIDYAAEAGPTVGVRVQALFGLAEHPTVAGGAVPLVLALTSPAGRPIQTTRDLPGFWRGSWREVAREMRGRYPKHPWPDDPAAAAPTLRTKRRS